MASDELTYYEDKYGGFGGSSSDYGSAYGGGPPPSVVDGSAFLPAYTEADKGWKMKVTDCSTLPN